MFGCDGLAFGQHPEKEGLKKLMRTVFIGISQSGSVDRSSPEMVKALGLGRQPSLDSTQAVLPGQLSKKHGDEMIPGTESTGVVFRSGLRNELLKFISRKYLKHLTQ